MQSHLNSESASFSLACFESSWHHSTVMSVFPLLSPSPSGSIVCDEDLPGGTLYLLLLLLLLLALLLERLKTCRGRWAPQVLLLLLLLYSLLFLMQSMSQFQFLVREIAASVLALKDKVYLITTERATTRANRQGAMSFQQQGNLCSSSNLSPRSLACALLAVKGRTDGHKKFLGLPFQTKIMRKV